MKAVLVCSVDFDCSLLGCPELKCSEVYSSEVDCS